MFVSEWMTQKVFTVAPGDGVSDAAKLMKGKSVKHLPVMKGSKLKGIVSDRDIKEYIPTKATSLDVYELHYLMQKTKVKEIMRTEVTTTTPGTPVEEAARLMLDNNIGCLPVLESGKLAGIISDLDIFRVLVSITGIRHTGHRISLTLPDRPGSIKEVADIIRLNGFKLRSILTSYDGMLKGTRMVVIRTGMEGDFNALKKGLTAAFKGIRIIKG